MIFYLILRYNHKRYILKNLSFIFKPFFSSVDNEFRTPINNTIELKFIKLKKLSVYILSVKVSIIILFFYNECRMEKVLNSSICEYKNISDKI